MLLSVLARLIRINPSSADAVILVVTQFAGGIIMANRDTKASTPNPVAAEDHAHKPTWTEQIHVRGDELVACVKRLAAEGQVKRIRVIEPDGDIMIEMPLTIGAIAGGAVILAAPMLAVVGALAAFVAEVKVEVVRGIEPAKKG
jgi:Domain of unknown function (DUF4342)